jgi:hypothetical protein
MSWTVQPAIDTASVLLLFESGAYYLTAGALRYRLGAEGRQPVTTELFLPPFTRFVAGSEAGFSSRPGRGAGPALPHSRLLRCGGSVTGALQNRPGVALAAAIVVLILIECIVAGMVHTVMTERRSAANAELALRARLAAASAAAAAAAAWTPGMDSLGTAGSAVLLDGVGPRRWTRCPHRRGAAGRAACSSCGPSPAGPAAPVARAAEAILVVPPAFHIGADPAGAALSAAAVVLESGAVVDAGNQRVCARAMLQPFA